jgi:glycolate oxidase FAD binding subunit
MGAAAVERESPASAADCAAVLEAAAGRGTGVRIVGAGTKRAWGERDHGESLTELSTTRLDSIIEHNEGDLTAVLGAGVPLAVAQETFAGADQMLALDPPDAGATLGGVVATADSGPLRARYGAARDLVVGITVALADGTVAKAGGKVIKNVAGYDLAKLFTGSYGTLGAIVQLSVRLHPLPPATATAVGETADRAALAAAAADLSHSPFEQQSLDVRWRGGRGALLARFGSTQPRSEAEAAERLMTSHALDTEIVEEDDSLWTAQRDGQRSATGTLVKVSTLQTRLDAVLVAAERLGAPMVARAGLGLAWLAIEERAAGETLAAVNELCRELEPAACVVLDAPAEVRRRLEPRSPLHAGALELNRRVKERFDPSGVCNPGVYAGGIQG